MRLWIESAQQSQGGAADGAPGSLISTLTTEKGFVGLVMSRSLGPEVESRARSMSDGPWSSYVNGLLSALPGDEHAPLAILCVRDGSHASLLECDAPPLFMARRGRLVLLPVVEEEWAGHLLRTCEFDLRDGDHLAMLSEGYIGGIGAGKPGPFVGWREVAVAVRRLTETRCNAEQLAGALIRQYQRLTGDETGSSKLEAGSRQGGTRMTQYEATLPGSSIQYPVSVLAMFVRPMRTLTIWTGPPENRAAEKHMLDILMQEEDIRVVCGDTTAEIVARMLGAELVMEPSPEEGWTEVPPVSGMAFADSRGRRGEGEPGSPGAGTWRRRQVMDAGARATAGGISEAVEDLCAFVSL
jgi:hypothetical protein